MYLVLCHSSIKDLNCFIFCRHNSLFFLIGVHMYTVETVSCTAVLPHSKGESEASVFQELIKTVAFLGFHSLLFTSGWGGGGAELEEHTLESVIEH